MICKEEWTKIPPNLFTDGITNKLLACYVDQCMNDAVLVRVYGKRTELFVDRRCQTSCVAGVCQQFLQDEGIEAMDWLACSPDLNPIEHICDIMSRTIHQSHVAPQTLQELADALVQVLEEIPQETIRRLIRSMPRHCREVIQACGGHTSFPCLEAFPLKLDQPYMDNDDSRIRGRLCQSLIGGSNLYDIIVAMATIMTSTSILFPSLNQRRGMSTSFMTSSSLCPSLIGRGLEASTNQRHGISRTDRQKDRQTDGKTLRQQQQMGQVSIWSILWGHNLRLVSPSVLDFLNLIALEMAKYHCIPAQNGRLPRASLWQKLNKYLSILHTEEGPEDRLQAGIPSMKVLEEELTWLQKYLPSLESPIVFCHNDLLCKNVIYNEEEGHVRFIDYEYAGFNYQAYDIANHFNEFAGVSEPDYRLFPDRKTQLDWLRHYLVACKRLRGEKEEPQDKEVDDLCIQVNQFVLASHFFWGLWALIQHRFSDIDFNFAQYAMLRFQQYFHVKPQVTALWDLK
ncbi:unnamed protein product [Ranitomeya imitator]|uniref:ethanolamine kinase n=1 Tax=Ranitomeya imitator TaxID=111125 RepID=A0ABN9MMD7_9NEOB|nr:unnamed protein product [Ranitomeya imitator]